MAEGGIRFGNRPAGLHLVALTDEGASSHLHQVRFVLHEEYALAVPSKLIQRKPLRLRFVVVDENPLENLKVLYGIGAVKLTLDNEVVRVGGIKYTIKDGIIFDAQHLLGDVRAMVRAAKNREGFEITQPGRGPFR